MPSSCMPPLSAAAAAAAARLAHARQSPHATPSPAASTGRQASLPVSQQPSLATSQAYPSQQGWGAASLPLTPQHAQQGAEPSPPRAHVLLEHILQGRGLAPLQPQQPGTPSGSLSGQAAGQPGSLLPGGAAAPVAGLPHDPGAQLRALRQQQLEQQRQLELAHQQQQQQLLAQLLQAQQRTAPPPWVPFLLPAAQAALKEATVTRDRCLQVSGARGAGSSQLSAMLAERLLGRICSGCRAREGAQQCSVSLRPPAVLTLPAGAAGAPHPAPSPPPLNPPSPHTRPPCRL